MVTIYTGSDGKNREAMGVDVLTGGGGVSLAAAGKQTAKTATAAGAQDIAAANPDRTSFDFTNNHATVAVRVKEGADAAANSGYRVMAGGSYYAVTKDRVSVCPESGSADCFGYEVVA